VSPKKRPVYDAQVNASTGKAMTGPLRSRRGVSSRLDSAPLGQNALDALLSQVTKDNLHAEADTGPAVGREQW